MEFQDRTLKCIDCGADFVFTAGEQLFFHDKQFKNEPKRCKACKGKRAAQVDTTKLRPRRPAPPAGKKPPFRSSPRKDARSSAASASSRSAHRPPQPKNILLSPAKVNPGRGRGLSFLA
jgi:putative zinc ribbon protein